MISRIRSARSAHVHEGGTLFPPLFTLDCLVASNRNDVGRATRSASLALCTAAHSCPRTMSPIAVQAGHVIGTSARLPRHRGIVTVLHAYCGYICKRYKFSSYWSNVVPFPFLPSVFHVFSLSFSFSRARGDIVLLSPRPDASFIPRRIFVTKDCEKPAAPIHSSPLSPCIVVEFFFLFYFLQRERGREKDRFIIVRETNIARNSTSSFIHGSLEKKSGNKLFLSLSENPRCKGYFTFF